MGTSLVAHVLCVLVVLASLYCHCCSADGRYLVGDDYVYRLTNGTGGKVCMTVSLNADILIYYRTDNSSNDTDIKDAQFSLPTKQDVNMSGNCMQSSWRTLTLNWTHDSGETDCQMTFNFTVKDKEWYLAQVHISFDLDNGTLFESPEVTGVQSYQTTSEQGLFNRTFGSNQYFYCKACKKLWLRESDNTTENSIGPCYKRKSDNITVCSQIFLSHSVLYPGDLDDNNNVKKKLCLEDFINLQEIIIPSVVGGILGLLLIVIFVAYLIAFIRRKRREGQYETINDAY